MLLAAWFIRNHLPSSPEATTSVPTPMAVDRATTPNRIKDHRDGEDLPARIQRRARLHPECVQREHDGVERVEHVLAFNQPVPTVP